MQTYFRLIAYKGGFVVRPCSIMLCNTSPWPENGAATSLTRYLLFRRFSSGMTRRLHSCRPTLCILFPRSAWKLLRAETVQGLHNTVPGPSRQVLFTPPPLERGNEQYCLDFICLRCSPRKRDHNDRPRHLTESR